MSVMTDYETNIIKFGDELARFLEDGTGYKEIIETKSKDITSQDEVFIIERGTREEADSISNISVEYIINFYLSDLLNYKQEREEINRLELEVLNNLTNFNLCRLVEDRGSFILDDTQTGRKILRMTLSFTFAR
jgi:hypothetical protein